MAINLEFPVTHSRDDSFNAFTFNDEIFAYSKAGSGFMSSVLADDISCGGIAHTGKSSVTIANLFHPSRWTVFKGIYQ